MPGIRASIFKTREALFGKRRTINRIMDKSVKEMPDRQISRKEAERITALMRTGMSRKQAIAIVAKEVAGKDRNIW